MVPVPACTKDVHMVKHQAVTSYGGVNFQSNAFLTPALSRGEWSTSRLGRLTPGAGDARYPLDVRVDGRCREEERD